MLSFRGKLLLISGIFFVPCLISAIVIELYLQNKITFVKSQINGLEAIAATKPLAVLTAKHRGNMSQYLNGANEKAAQLDAIESELENALQHASAYLDAENITTFRKHWQNLTRKNNVLDKASNFQAHSDLIVIVFQNIDLIANESGLLLNKHLELHYLASLIVEGLPELSEFIGQLRGIGSGAITDKQISNTEDIQIKTLLSLVSHRQKTAKFKLSLLGNYERLNNLISNSDIARANKALEDFFAATSKLEPGQETLIENSQYFALGSDAIEQTLKLDNKYSAIIEELLQNELQQDRLQAHVIIISTLVLIVVSWYCVLGVRRSITHPIENAADACEKMATGDFTITVEKQRNDIIGSVSNNLAKMILQIRQLLEKISHSSGDVKRHAEILTQNTEQSRVEIEQQMQQSQMNSSSTYQMIESIREVARNCNQLVTETTETENCANKGLSLVQDMNSIINALAKDVDNTSTIITELQNDSKQIDTVVEVITGIAEQTNLLALNAAIEAARAGEQGRGFAVVADEVRSLAQRTQQSTAEIKTIIDQLQDRASEAVLVTEKSLASANKTVDKADQTSASITEIVEHLSNLSALNGQIAAATEEQSASSEEISRNTEALNQATQKLVEQVEHNQEISLIMAKHANSLSESVSAFKLHKD